MDLQWRQRRKRIRKWLKPLPRRANVRRYPVLKRFSGFAHKRPYLWSFKNAPVVRAIYLGSILTFMPSYGLQIIIAFAAALIGRANLSILVGLQMLNNPLTIGPMYLATYAIGSQLMGLTHLTAKNTVVDGALALVLGGLVLGALTGMVLHVAWQIGRYESARFRHKRMLSQSESPSIPLS